MRTKLIRDRVPDLIRSNGQKPILTIADEADMRALLIAKLREEIDELKAAHVCDEIDELVDLAQVIRSLARHLGLEWDKIEQLRQLKLEHRGAFTRRLVWHGNRGGAA